MMAQTVATEAKEAAPKNIPDAAEAARGALETAVAAGEDWRDALWDCIRAHQGILFETAGRGRQRTGAVSFSYVIKTSKRTGEETEELLISRKENSKSLTRSTVELGFENALSEQLSEGCVRGPKRLRVFGASYLYAMFLAWGMIRKKRGELLLPSR